MSVCLLGRRGIQRAVRRGDGHRVRLDASGSGRIAREQRAVAHLRACLGKIAGVDQLRDMIAARDSSRNWLIVLIHMKHSWELAC